MEVEIIHEPSPVPRASGLAGGDITVRLIDSKTGEQVSKASGRVQQNERRTREERKY